VVLYEKDCNSQYSWKPAVSFGLYLMRDLRGVLPAATSAYVASDCDVLLKPVANRRYSDHKHNDIEQYDEVAFP
jgi:hypothetical protein